MPVKNEITPYVRSVVNLWLAGRLHPFCVVDIVTDIVDQHSVLEGVDLIKVVSNELIRLERKHKLGSEPGVRGVHGCGIGRVPRLYTIKVKFKKESVNSG